MRREPNVACSATTAAGRPCLRRAVTRVRHKGVLRPFCHQHLNQWSRMEHTGWRFGADLTPERMTYPEHQA